VGRLLRALQDAGDGQAVAVLLERDPAAHADPSDPSAVVYLLEALRQAGAEREVAALAARTAAHAELTDPYAVAQLLRALQDAGDGQGAAALTTRLENTGQHPEHFAPYGREPDGRRSPPWTWHSVTQESDQLRHRT
jgi:hypothetical protein